MDCGNLVLARKVGESVMIGDDVELFVKEIKGTVVRFAIRAPKSTEIVRGELVDREAA